MILQELFDPATTFPLEWENDGGKETFATAYDADGRTISISFIPVSDNAIEITFTRGGSYDLTGRGDAARVMSTVINAISVYLQKYKPPYVVFSAKSAGGRASAYTAMIRRIAHGYKLLNPVDYPERLGGFIEFLGSDKPFVLARQ